MKDKIEIRANELTATLVKEIAENHMKILDDFGKAYMSSRWKDYFSKQKKIDLRRLELVEDRSEMPTKVIYHYRLKKGKLKNYANRKRN